MTVYCWCPYCSELCEDDGPNGILVHALAFHPTSDLARSIVEELAAVAVR